MKSLRRSLLLLLLGTMLLLMLVAGAVSYRAGMQEAGEMFDARLVQSTRVLASLVDESLQDLPESMPQPIVLHGWHGHASGVGTALAFANGHAYENKLAFQVRDAQQRLLLRSDSAPATPLAPLRPGFADVDIEGHRWRTFSLPAEHGQWYQSAERADIRAELAADIAVGTLWPLLLALPLMALAIWWGVNRATRSLQHVSDQIGERDPQRMAPLQTSALPLEVHGLVHAVNGLLQRLEQALTRERRFIADAAHELRTPISALKLHADNASHSEDESERQQAQRLLAGSVQRLERLLAQLLALNRARGAGVIERTQRLSLDALVATEAEQLRALAERRRQTLDLQLVSLEVSCEEIALATLLRNLLDNALRYSPDAGIVRVWLGQDPAEPMQAILLIEDSGPGIAEDERERVFDRFYRSLGSGVEGSGLGLAIVREIAQYHDLRISLGSSAALGGLQVRLSIPLWIER